MIEQVLFTSPGERVNLPSFGCGLDQALFGPLEDDVMALTRIQVLAALQRWLGDVIDVQDVHIEGADSRMSVHIRYRRRDTNQVEGETFTRTNDRGVGHA